MCQFLHRGSTKGEQTRARPPAITKPNAEAALADAAPSKMGEPVGVGGLTTPVDAIVVGDATPDGIMVDVDSQA